MFMENRDDRNMRMWRRRRSSRGSGRGSSREASFSDVQRLDGHHLRSKLSSSEGNRRRQRCPRRQLDGVRWSDRLEWRQGERSRLDDISSTGVIVNRVDWILKAKWRMKIPCKRASTCRPDRTGSSHSPRRCTAARSRTLCIRSRGACWVGPCRAAFGSTLWARIHRTRYRNRILNGFSLQFILFDIKLWNFV